MEFFVWGCDNEDKAFAWIRDFSQIIESEGWRLKEGQVCEDWFPENPEIQICSEKGIKLTDAIPNYSKLLVVSEKLKSILEEHSGADFEYFPVTMLDKKGRPDKRPYYVANLLDTVDCVDMEQSEYRMNRIIKDQVDRFARLVLDESKIPADKAIFRLKDKTDLIIINDPLSDAILDADCEGVAFELLEEHGSIYRKS